MERLKKLKDTANINKDFKKASVMMLVYPRNGEAHFVLIERQKSAGKHSGQIAFPGGRHEESDRDNKHTALREFEEEVGVSVVQEKVIKQGTSLYIPPSNYIVYSYLAFAKAEPTFTPQQSEVKSIKEIPLRLLLDKDSLGTTTISTTYMQEAEVPCFYFDGLMVWGATAMILAEFKELMATAFDD